MRKLSLLAVAGTLLIAGSSVQADELLTKAGTMQLGGQTSFSIDMFMPDKGDSQTGFWLDISPSAGYFVIDDLELSLGANLGLGFGDLYDGTAKNYGFSLKADYFIGVSSFKLHIGAGLGMSIMSPDKGDSLKSLVIGVPIGLLIPLNQHVAVDLGTTIAFMLGLDDQGNNLNVPLGYLGVQSFF